MKIGFWSLVGAFISAFGLIEFFAWIFSGKGIGEQLGGDSSPLVVAVAEQISGMSSLAFWGACALVVCIMSAILSIVIVYSIGAYKKGGKA